MKKLFKEKENTVFKNISKQLASKPFFLNGMLKERKSHFLVLGIIFIAIMLFLWLLGRYGMLM